MSLEKTLKRLILPKTSYRTIKTTQFSEAASQVVTTALGNEGLDLLLWIQERIDDGSIVISGAGNTDLSIGTHDWQSIEILSSTGDSVVIPAATDTLAGLMTSADKVDLAFLLGDHQSAIQFQDEGSNLGLAGTVNTIDFTGSAIQAIRTGNKVTVNVTGGSGTGIMETESDNTLILYTRKFGAGVPSASRAGGISTITAPSGVSILSVAVKGQSSDLSGDNSFKIVINGVPGTGLLAYPTVSKWNLSGAAPSDAVPHIQDIDNTPGVQITNGTAGTSVTVKIINLNAFTNWVIKLGWL